MEKPSEFEQFVSGETEITDVQLEILKGLEGIAFSHSLKRAEFGQTAVSVRIVKYSENAQGVSVSPVQVDAGFIIGTREAIADAFKKLGIRSPFVISTDLKQFGYDLFRQPLSAFGPAENVPAGADYIVGPGDEIKITVWGKIEGQWNVVVDRDGTIALPKIGIMGVTGLTFKELKEVLYNGLSKYYTGFEMNVGMGSLRSIRVYVVGNAQRPGAYTVSSLATLVNALFDSGGPGKTGSMRDIQVKRNGKTLVNFDLYEFLLKGDKTKDIRLMSEDVIFIPPVGPLAAIAGSVNNPAIYELKGESKIAELITLSGGLNTIATKNRVQVERIVDGNRQVVFESTLDDIKENDLALQSGDVLKIFQVVREQRTIKVSGAVQREGEYGFSAGSTVTVKDLVAMAGGLKYYAYTKEAELTRVEVTDKGPVTEKIVIDLEKALAGDPANNISLKEDDYLFVRTVPEWQTYTIVSIAGEVRFPGVYTIMRGEKISSLIARAGGFTDKAYLRGAIFTRKSVQELQQKNIDEMIRRLERDLLGAISEETATALTSEEAKIKAYEIEQKTAFIKKLKEVKATGRVSIAVNEPEHLKKTSYDIELEEGDSLFIPSNPSTVQVIGAVYNQTAFVFDRDKNYSNYIDLAGGYTDSADEDNEYILKVDGTAVRPDSGGLLWSKNSNRWEFASQDVEPGDTIVVPEELEKISWMREIKDITQIMYQIAVTAGVLIVAF
ncbi:MAG: SLBB domain-containing protein [Nitrospirota bacterium]|nr:SLBB domain-containing protein [Nitrospirota bacterium]